MKTRIGFLKAAFSKTLDKVLWNSGIVKEWGTGEGAFALSTKVCLYKIPNCDAMIFWPKLSHLHNIKFPLTNGEGGKVLPHGTKVEGMPNCVTKNVCTLPNADDAHNATS